MSKRKAFTRVSVDIGGTFTDVVLERNGHRRSTKVLTTHQAPEQGLLEGVLIVLKQEGIGLDDLDVFLHGTTLATNAIIERRGAKTALVTTAGFRDTIEIGTESRHDQYDIFLKKPKPLVPREWRFPVAGRIDAHGRILQDFSAADVEEAAAQIADMGIGSVAISFLHAYANPDHELRAREILRSRLPNLWISISSEVCPEVREYERASTTCANAYVRPIMASYLGRVEGELRDRGMAAPILLMTSGGSLTTIKHASDFPVRLVESGPAGGAILAANIAAECGLRQILSFDMGGTTAKVCLIDDGQPLKSRTFEVDRTERFLKGSGLPVRIPVIEMVEIGAGGGSIAHVDQLGRVAVGPESASSEPGPAAYGRGGQAPTVSDADLVLGRLDPNRFAGGRIRLHRELAEKALQKDIGRKLSLDAMTSALAVSEMVEENMANASRVHAAEYGKDLRKRTLVAFGGAAPLHAARLASKLGLSSIIVPRGAGVGSAIGFLQAPVAYEVVRSHHFRPSQGDWSKVAELLREMEEEARAIVSHAAPSQALAVKGTAFMRYVGQGHDLQIDLPHDPVAASKDENAFVSAISKAFADAYKSVFGRALENHPIEIITWTITATAIDDADHSSPPLPPADGKAAPVGEAPLYSLEAGKVQHVPIYWRSNLPSGFSAHGPAIVVEEETSTVVTGGFDLSINESGHLLLTAKRVAASVSEESI
jgi:N-methylhydantoinase A